MLMLMLILIQKTIEFWVDDIVAFEEISDEHTDRSNLP